MNMSNMLMSCLGAKHNPIKTLQPAEASGPIDKKKLACLNAKLNYHELKLAYLRAIPNQIERGVVYDALIALEDAVAYIESYTDMLGVNLTTYDTIDLKDVSVLAPSDVLLGKIGDAIKKLEHIQNVVSQQSDKNLEMNQNISEVVAPVLEFFKKFDLLTTDLLQYTGTKPPEPNNVKPVVEALQSMVSASEQHSGVVKNFTGFLLSSKSELDKVQKQLQAMRTKLTDLKEAISVKIKPETQQILESLNAAARITVDVFASQKPKIFAVHDQDAAVQKPKEDVDLF